MQQSLLAGELALKYNPKFREYGMRILDGGESVVQIQVCPWCGAKLPTSLRDEWFDQLDKLGIDPYDKQIPEKYTTSAWWEHITKSS